MSFRFDERPESRQQTMNPPSQTRVYKAAGEQNDQTVAAYALAGTPSSIFTTQGTLYRQDIRIDPAGFRQYLVTVPYGPRPKQTGSYSFSFDTTGGTTNVKCAKTHLATYDAIDQVPFGNPHKGMIGVSGENVEGAEIVIPSLRFSVTYTHAQGVVTLVYMRSLSNATGKTNANPFLGFEAGELLFLGASGSDGSEAEASVTYYFQASYNVDDLGLEWTEAVIPKAGWEYAWTEPKSSTADVDGETVAAQQPKYLHVEQVYDEIDFATVFGWS